MAKPKYKNGWIKDLPDRVRIGNLTYEVEILGPAREREDHTFGACVNNDQIIRLGSMMKRQKARDTLMHEVLHAIVWCYNIPSKDEDLCTMLPMALDLFRLDNPKAWRFVYPEK